MDRLQRPRLNATITITNPDNGYSAQIKLEDILIGLSYETNHIELSGRIIDTDIDITLLPHRRIDRRQYQMSRGRSNNVVSNDWLRLQRDLTEQANRVVEQQMLNEIASAPPRLVTPLEPLDIETLNNAIKRMSESAAIASSSISKLGLNFYPEQPVNENVWEDMILNGTTKKDNN